MRITKGQLRRIIREQIDDVQQGELFKTMNDESTFKPGTLVYATGNQGDPVRGVVRIVHSNPTRYTVGWIDDGGYEFARDVVGPDEITLPEDWEHSW